MSKSQSSILDFVHQQEQQENTRLSQQLLDLYYIEYDNTTKPRILSKLFGKADSSAQKERYKSKLMHRYNERKIMDDPQIDKQLSNAWRKFNIRRRKLHISCTRRRTPNKISEKRKR